MIGIAEVWQKDKFTIQGYHQAFQKERGSQASGRRCDAVCERLLECHGVP